MENQKAHVVIVPASFAPSLLYSKFVQHLCKYDLDVTIVDLPSKAPNGVSKAERHAVQKPGGIVQLVYISSPVPEVGGSIMTIMEGNIPPFMKVEGGYLISDTDGCANVNFSDLPYTNAIQHARHMKAHSAESFSSPLHHAGYLRIPVTYIICEHDISVPPDFQRSVVDMITTKASREVTTLVCNSGHFPNVSFPAELANLINSVVIRGSGESLQGVRYTI
ncbi:conserved hypothetical protein [Talaromyces stipitatus ATCC 10500]|uniref:AB hydrolase-1 domain-containing protein n=1 Tax=Talaromyces stipitatus (strain ATCC 10500 / CBS 375.48 / QM 6759 / NRRL 1006) TaxID=441959 RepID=B8MLZ0_TALSN|nr:uncharacterized protein TSTA_097580 [Talaromyces stipitatus ATCC 10500]EED13502.1 conserved hypothetical protein [Talaromyces stipitatus ATCC 10500]